MRRCEKCWNDAKERADRTGRRQIECYGELLVERFRTPCKQEVEPSWHKKTLAMNSH